MPSFRACYFLYYVVFNAQVGYSWFHVKVCCVAGVGFFTDAYGQIDHPSRGMRLKLLPFQLRHFLYLHRCCKHHKSPRRGCGSHRSFQTMLGYVYNNGKTSLGTNEDLGIKVATPIGNLVGQILFGWLADVVGRKKMCM
jgi:PHS family inorganic phosphate transporter-like MFS transporter